MPTVDPTGKLPPELAVEDAGLMQLWGQINIAWDDIERLLYRAFDAMLSEETSYATQAIFYSQRSHEARREMVESLAKYALLNRPKTAQKLQIAIGHVKARSDDRNSLALGAWKIGVEHETGEQGLERLALSASPVPDPKDRYSRSRLEQIRDEMRSTAEALREAVDPIDAAKRERSSVLARRHMQKAQIIE